jgi:hypothetical protein
MWDATTFTKNRDRLRDGAVANEFLTAVLPQDEVKRLLSNDHFSVNGTLLEAWASPKSFRAKDGSGELPGPGRNGERDFNGERRRNDTHASTTDPDARLLRKGPGKEARLCFVGHALMENRNGLIVGAVTTRASGHAERPNCRSAPSAPSSLSALTPVCWYRKRAIGVKRRGPNGNS